MSTSAIPLFGQAWKLTVKYLSGGSVQTSEIVTQSGWDPEALRMTFDVLQSTLPSPYWYADISIYNLNEPTVQNYLFNAVWCTLEAGFQTGPSKSSIIWDGPVLQTLFDREDVVDQRTTLHCLASIPAIEQNIVNMQFGAMTQQAQAVSQMASSIGMPAVRLGTQANSLLQAKAYPRGLTVFGRASDFFGDVAEDNFLSTWNDGQNAYISELNSSATTPNLTFAPVTPPGYTVGQLDQSATYSIIGTPRQTPFGVIYTVLLDPRLKVGLPPLLVKLDNIVISQMKAYLGQVLNPVDASGLSVVAQVRHRGDTRGNEWYTEVTGYWRNYTTNLLQGIFNAMSNSQGAQ